MNEQIWELFSNKKPPLNVEVFVEFKNNHLDVMRRFALYDGTKFRPVLGEEKYDCLGVKPLTGEWEPQCWRFPNA